MRPRATCLGGGGADCLTHAEAALRPVKKCRLGEEGPGSPSSSWPCESIGRGPWRVLLREMAYSLLKRTMQVCPTGVGKALVGSIGQLKS